MKSTLKISLNVFNNVRIKFFHFRLKRFFVVLSEKKSNQNSHRFIIDYKCLLSIDEVIYVNLISFLYRNLGVESLVLVVMKNFSFVSVLCYFLLAMTQSNEFVRLNPNNPSVINNCKLVPGKSGFKGSKGEKGERGGIRSKQVKDLKGIKLEQEFKQLQPKYNVSSLIAVNSCR